MFSSSSQTLFLRQCLTFRTPLPTSSGSLIPTAGYVLELKKNRYFAGWYKDRIVCRSLEYARYFPSAEAAEEYVHKYLGFAGMTCYICHVNWTLASCGSENMEDNEENLLEENGKILSFANYADVKQYQKHRGMEHSTMTITYASRKKKIILAA